MNTSYACIGLGNPGRAYEKTRHNIGFLVLDALAEKHHASWHVKKDMAYAEITIENCTIFLIKPLTGMNNSGIVASFLKNHNIPAIHIVVVHDELEIPFGKIVIKQGGSARGHNGLRSLIAHYGADFYRLRFGIGRPAEREDVPNYVLTNFDEPEIKVEHLIHESVGKIEHFFISPIKNT